ncbi:MAG: hypothetical protein R3E01_01645 [Pirellulaceae bacterium]|nr:hypothetical protein [Planctomycetales bacterium]
MKTYHKSLGVAAIFLTCSVLAGCMTSPHQLEQVGDSRSDPFFVSGFLTVPNQTVVIQARNPHTSGWTTIATTTSSNSPYLWEGVNWYSYNRSISVPNSLWSSGFGVYVTELRATVNGTPVFTFKENFSDHWEIDKPLADLWEEAGNGDGKSIYVYVSGP